MEFTFAKVPDEGTSIQSSTPLPVSEPKPEPKFAFAHPDDKLSVPMTPDPVESEPKFAFAKPEEVQRAVPRVMRDPIIAGTAGLLRNHPGSVVADDGSIQLNPEGLK